MTALKEYQRLEATGLWRAAPEDQRREVVVSIGEATLTITDLNDRALTHWSLAAVDRIGDGVPAVYHPNGDPGESLELAAEEAEMIDAIERLRKAVERARPHPGRLRVLSGICLFLAVAILFVFWLPDALQRHTLSVVPQIKRAELGEEILLRIERVAGKACGNHDSGPILARLAQRTGVEQIVVLKTGLRSTALLPGQVVLINKSLVEDHEDPVVTAGYILAETARARREDPLAALLTFAGPVGTFRLLTTGSMTEDILDRYAEHLLLAPRPRPDLSDVVEIFDTARVPTRPYAYAVDITGETVLDLIESDPLSGQLTDPIMPDRDWILLQSICGG